jgi:hypothetical protein
MSTQTITEDPRRARGQSLAGRVSRRGAIFVVPSSHEGSWVVRVRDGVLICDCPDFVHRKQKCKHVWAVEIYLHRAGAG